MKLSIIKDEETFPGTAALGCALLIGPPFLSALFYAFLVQKLRGNNPPRGKTCFDL